jgi:hypothetical protein
MKPGFRERLAAIPWTEYRTAYGDAAGEHWFETASGQRTERWGSVPEQLIALASSDVPTAMAASHHLWCCLCHQHAYVSSAALPALPFLLEIIEDASDEVAVEILDIVAGFATCSNGDASRQEGWVRELRTRLVAEQDRFAQLANHAHSGIADWSGRVLEELGLGAAPRVTQ